MKHLKHVTMPLKADSNENDNDDLVGKFEGLIDSLLFWKD